MEPSALQHLEETGRGWGYI